MSNWHCAINDRRRTETIRLNYCVLSKLNRKVSKLKKNKVKQVAAAIKITTCILI
jgi:hypothetical protein